MDVTLATNSYQSGIKYSGYSPFAQSCYASGMYEAKPFDQTNMMPMVHAVMVSH